MYVIYILGGRYLRVILNAEFHCMNSQVMRLWMPYADDGAEIILVISVHGVNNRRFTFLEGGIGRVTPLSRIPAIGDGSPHGSYFWDQATTMVYVKMTGTGKTVQV